MLRVSSDLTRPAFPRARGATGKCEWAVLTPAYCGGAGPIWSCSGWGLPSYPDHSGYWWALTPPFHPYPPRPKPWKAVCFLWHFPYPVLYKGRNSPCYGPPCPVELGLSSPPDFPLCVISGGATICSPSFLPFPFFSCNPPLNRLIGQTVSLLVLFSWNGLDIE